MKLQTQHEPFDGHRDIPVQMVRETLDDSPAHKLPNGYSIRWYEAGDELHWMRIHLECEGYAPLRTTLFREQFGTDEDELKRRVAFVCREDGVPVSTNTAWMSDWNGRHWGQVHWVATIREEQGKGLSKPMMTAVMERLRELGHERAFLKTNTLRVRAIALYAGFGFKPYWESDEEREAWEELLPRMEAMRERR